jgi:guanosine-3',5'-bis(diphosphate) 3'-pyrophosphohydrolase
MSSFGANFAEALKFAAESHKDQVRKDKTRLPYIYHPVAVAENVMRAGVRDPEIVAAALLHDTIEDCGVSSNTIASIFGDRVAEIVRECSDDKSLSKVERKKLQIVHAATVSHGAKIVKLADKLANLTDLLHSKPEAWSEEEVVGYVVWAYHVVKAIGNVNADLTARLSAVFLRLGIIGMVGDLEKELQNYYERMSSSS